MGARFFVLLSQQFSAVYFEYPRAYCSHLQKQTSERTKNIQQRIVETYTIPYATTPSSSLHGEREFREQMIPQLP